MERTFIGRCMPFFALAVVAITLGMVGTCSQLAGAQAAFPVYPGSSSGGVTVIGGGTSGPSELVCDGGVCTLTSTLNVNAVDGGASQGNVTLNTLYVQDGGRLCFDLACSNYLASTGQGALLYNGTISMQSLGTTQPLNTGHGASSSGVGNANLDTNAGVSAVATDAGQVTITQSAGGTTAAYHLLVTPMTLDANCAEFKTQTFDGGFTLTCAAAPLQDWYFSWFLWR
jgi:hypothetical protein